MLSAAQIYLGNVMHRRTFPVRYKFVYRVFSMLVDIDQVDRLACTLRLFSHNRFNLFSFFDADHGPRDGSPLRPWIDRMLNSVGVNLGEGRIMVLCFPRLLGYCFNPLSVWYCYNDDKQLCAIVCEVKNTFNEQHCYVLHDHGSTMEWPVRKHQPKKLHVSPFIGMEAEYQFRLSAPGDALTVVIREYQNGELMLAATQNGSRHDMTDRMLLRLVTTMPLMTLMVIVRIHWQALKIWVKGAPFHTKPLPPKEDFSR
jgi:DUF1365 family protein